MSLVSVIIPNYNHVRFLAERIESVLNQSFTDFECIVLDDASSDNSKEIIEWYAARDTRIRFYPSENNSGSPFVQWNRGVALASNDLIWIAESDDTCDTGLLQALVNEHLQNPHIALSYCQSLKIDATGNTIGTWKDFTNDLDTCFFKENFIIEGMKFISNFLINKNIIPNASAVIFRKKIYDLVGGAPEDLKTNGDWLTWLKMLCFGRVAFISEPLNYFRYHDDSVIGKLKQANNSIDFSEQYDRGLRKKFKKYLNENNIFINPRTRFINDQYISYDNGNEAIHLFEKKKMLKALPLLVSSTFSPKFKSGYLKKILFK